VTDWIDVGIGLTRWPTFNVADIGISLGVLFLAILLIWSPSPDGHRSAGGSEEI
jgi:lipoprotein signal peptidase